MKKLTYKNIMIGLIVACAGLVCRFAFNYATTLYKKKAVTKANAEIYAKANAAALGLDKSDALPGSFYTYDVMTNTITQSAADDSGDIDNDGIVDVLNVTFDNASEPLFYPGLDYEDQPDYTRYTDCYGGYSGLVGLPFSYEAEDPVIRFFKYHEDDSTMYYYATMKITNTGTSNLYISDDNEFVISANGVQIDSANYLSCTSNVILPNESAYIYMNYSRSISASYKEEAITITPYYVVKTTIDTPLTYEVSNPTLESDEYGDLELEGYITNRTKQDADYIKITAILYDKDNNILAIRQSYDVDELGINETDDFEVEFYSTDFSREDVYCYEVIASDYYTAY